MLFRRCHCFVVTDFVKPLSFVIWSLHDCLDQKTKHKKHDLIRAHKYKTFKDLI